MCADEIIDELQARVDSFGQVLTSVIQKESFGDTKKSAEIIARTEQLTISSENTLTDIYDHRDHIENTQKKHGKVK